MPPRALYLLYEQQAAVLLGKVICSALLGEEDYLWGQAYQRAAKQLEHVSLTSSA